MKPIRVLIADESVFIRQQITKMLSGREDITVIGGAGNGSEAVVKVLDLYPSVVLMSCQMPLVSGFEALEKIKELTGIPVIMMLINRKNPEADRREALERGAVDCIIHRSALLSKDILDLKNEFIEIITNVSASYEEYKLIHPRKPVEVTKTINTERTAKNESPNLKPPYKRRHLPPGIIEIVIVGISTGGPQSLEDVISRLPATMPVPIVVIQHMPMEFTKSFARRLNTIVHLEVKEASHGMRLESGTVYIAPGGLQMSISAEKTIVITDGGFDVAYSPSIDVITHSIVTVYGGNALGVMMTGMGNDGLVGFRELHKAGGYILAQDEESCVIYGMSKAVIDDAIVNEIHSLQDIPEAIASCFTLKSVAPPSQSTPFVKSIIHNI
ncbi:MAG: chemotaxis-specific protein-glutamate methyltransferase CheB [Ignavibacteria bacterium]|nr:chemotaxis-specific protein-glutamate methyltransferase CheB [Ignavibacteria bacterium]